MEHRSGGTGRRPSVGKRMLPLLAVVVLLAAVAGAVGIRQLVFGGTPQLHRGGTPATSQPCTLSPVPSGYEAFALDSTRSSVSYTAHFLAAGASVPGTVTGETGSVTGEFLLAMAPVPALRSLRLTVDLRTLDSGSADRDQHIRSDTFDTARFPFAVFTVAQAQIVSGSYAPGQSVHFSLSGELSMHGVTHPVTFNMQGERSNDTITGLGTAPIDLDDFHMPDPEITSIVPITVDRHITLTVQLAAESEACQ